MRYIEIDGKRYEINQCSDCPLVFYDNLTPVCNHPSRPPRVTKENVVPVDCPLRSDDLLPCPFCGGEAEKFTFTSEGRSKECVRCKECDVSTGWYFGIGNDKYLARIWNRRAKGAKE